MLKIKNVVKSDKVVQLNNIASVTGNSGTYVKIGVTTHSQYNNDVSMLNYQKYTKYQNYTIYNPMLYIPTDETLVKSTFVTIGDEPMICNCIKIQDIFNFYASGCIQQFYECFCESHTHEESKVLARFLSAIGIEIWRDITCYGGIYKDRYMVSNMGNVKRLYKKHAKTLKQYEYGHGYLYVHLWYNYQRKCVRVHRLVGMTFYGEPTEPLECCHSNTNRCDNRLFNLEFKTHHENMQNPLTLKKCKESAIKADKAKSKAESTESAPTLE